MSFSVVVVELPVRRARDELYPRRSSLRAQHEADDAAAFSDADGDGWLLQEVKTRPPGR